MAALRKEQREFIYFRENRRIAWEIALFRRILRSFVKRRAAAVAKQVAALKKEA